MWIHLGAVALASAIAWWWRRASAPRHEVVTAEQAGTATVAGYPQPHDVLGWEDRSQVDEAVRYALVFWSNVGRLEPEISLPTWIELTTGEQKALVESFRTGDLAPLERVVDSAMLRAEERFPDARRHRKTGDLAVAALGGT